MAEEDQSKKKAKNPKIHQVRKECLKRKTMELSTLCDIKVCTVIMSPQGELQTWPENLDAVTEILDLYTQTLKPEKKEKESSEAREEEEENEENDEGRKDLLALVESKLDAVNKRIRFLENKNIDAAGKGKKQRIE